MRSLIWNKLAKVDYYENIDYLLREWSEKEAQEFIDEVQEIENILRKGVVEFQDTDRQDVKRCVICRQVTLFYRVIDSNTIELLRFWNNHKDIKALHL
ncbi:MAG TPA: hypothetical protein PLH91_04375 [Tenuifilaceae bacterium]|nr:hypothetical protein [Tenuifilaceae bacterium]HOZ13669.1 hypothetical protein [Tenuifilaceae bacterium]HPI44447.1 hypothetical protein [Tenuifilaceae bacterium]HPN20377.1 hypothetical protein [Tenuifilaceae bacterium]HPV56789.1 hypothetical protein [Tenuifilaceae bacterium]